MRLLDMLQIRSKKVITEDDVMNMFSVVANAKTPMARKAIKLALPVKISLSVAKSDFGSQAPVELLSQATLRGGRGIQARTSFVLDGQVLQQELTDKTGSARAQHVFTTPAAYSVRSYIGPVVEQNQAYAEKSINVVKLTVDAPIGIVFSANNKEFSTPAQILFPFYDGSPGYSLTFPQTVVKADAAWLLQAPAYYNVAGSRELLVPYVKPVLSISSASPVVLAGDTVSLVATITTVQGQVLPYQPVVIIKDGGEIYSSSSDQAGRVSMSLALDEGVHEFRASWLGMNFSESIRIEAVLPVLQLTGPSEVDADQPFSLTVSSRTRDGRGVNNLPLVMSVDNQFISNISTDGSGDASIPLSLAAGQHIVSVAWKDRATAVLNILARVRLEGFSAYFLGSGLYVGPRNYNWTDVDAVVSVARVGDAWSVALTGGVRSDGFVASPVFIGYKYRVELSQAGGPRDDQGYFINPNVPLATVEATKLI